MNILVANGLPTIVIAISAVGRRGQLGHTKGNGGRCINEPAAMDSTYVGVYIIKHIDFGR